MYPVAPEFSLSEPAQGQKLSAPIGSGANVGGGCALWPEPIFRGFVVALVVDAAFKFFHGGRFAF